MTTKNAGVFTPGTGARAVDTILDDFITNAREFQLSQDWGNQDYCYEITMLIAYMVGYAGTNVTLRTAWDVVTNLVRERRNIDERTA